MSNSAPTPSLMCLCTLQNLRQADVASSVSMLQAARETVRLQEADADLAAAVIEQDLLVQVEPDVEVDVCEKQDDS